MGRVRWTQEAVQWLREIRDHIAPENPSAATRTVRAIYEKALSLDTFPNRGYPHTTSSGISLRILLYEHYRIAYSVTEDGDVNILGVFHGAIDMDRHLP